MTNARIILAQQNREESIMKTEDYKLATQTKAKLAKIGKTYGKIDFNKPPTFPRTVADFREALYVILAGEADIAVTRRKIALGLLSQDIGTVDSVIKEYAAIDKEIGRANGADVVYARACRAILPYDGVRGFAQDYLCQAGKVSILKPLHTLVNKATRAECDLHSVTTEDIQALVEGGKDACLRPGVPTLGDNWMYLLGFAEDGGNQSNSGNQSSQSSGKQSSGKQSSGKQSSGKQSSGKQSSGKQSSSGAPPENPVEVVSRALKACGCETANTCDIAVRVLAEIAKAPRPEQRGLWQMILDLVKEHLRESM